MYGMDVLFEEHRNIVKFVGVLKKKCCEMIDNKSVNVDEMMEFANFASNYADKHHHVKEEKVLFRLMLEELGPVADKVVRAGMFVEHDLARFTISQWKEALKKYSENPSTENLLDVITNASSYADLLNRHAEKEDNAVYTFAMRSLSKEAMETVDKETKALEDEAMKNGIQDKYLSWLKKYLN